MKRTIAALLLLSPALSYAQGGAYTLKGTFSGQLPVSKVYLQSIVNNKIVLDSTELKNGAFTFQGQVPGPVRAQVVLLHGTEAKNAMSRNVDMQDLYLDQETITLQGKDSVATAVISGSVINEQYKAYQQASAPGEKEMAQLNRRMVQPDADKAALRTQFKEALTNWKKQMVAFSQANPDSYFSLIAIANTVDAAINVAEIEPLYKTLSARVRSTPFGLSFGKEIEATRNVTIGAMAPQFTQADTSGRPVSLSSFMGKYVLIDFWASWCKPCRMENPFVVKAFDTYNDKNFTVLSVSLDREGHKEDWLKAIHADGLGKWTHVSDLKFWDNVVAKQYGVGAVPQNYLIDPFGRIIASGLHGEGLLKKLQEIFPNP